MERGKPQNFFRGFLGLPETHDNSNTILLRIPIEIGNSARSEKAISVAEGPLHCTLPLSPATITRLQDVRLIHRPRPVLAKRLPIDYGALQKTYRQMFTEGGFASQTSSPVTWESAESG